MDSKRIFNSVISIGTYSAFIDEIFHLVQSKVPAYVCFANVHMVVEAYHDKSFQRLINNANIVAPDGRPLSLFLRLFEGIKQDRVCGMDILPDLLSRAEATGKSVYFYGTTDEILERVIQKAQIEFPALKIAGCFSPPFRALSKEEDIEITEKIREAHPDLIFVSLGCPKQERWMAEHKNKISACFLGLGQAFKVYAGVEKRLPKWMRYLSMEWLYRLYLEPKRLWRRYLYTNSFFIFLIIRYVIRRFFHNVEKRIGRHPVFLNEGQL